ncbi:MAG: DUF488 family protein, N3 subclade [Bacteroidales bacterium]
MVRTSYFSGLKSKGINPTDCIAICRVVPNGWTGEKAIRLAPSQPLLKAMLDGYLGEKEFERLYIEQLESSIDDASKIRLARFVDGKVLVCYEKTGDFCHRHILAKWMRERCGIEVSEA